MARAKRPEMRPATSEENRERQLVSLAYDLAERQLLDGSAPPATVNHLLKTGSSRERLEKSRLQKENELLAAKVEALQSAKRVEELYAQALDAMRAYNGHELDQEDEFYDDDGYDY